MTPARYVLIATLALAGLIVGGFVLLSGQIMPQEHDESAIASPYAGQEVRGIKSLSQDDVEGLLAGAGTPFGGMAKSAELNGYPGPRHVLDAIEAGEFEVSADQETAIRALYEEMKAGAITLGEQIIAAEQGIDDGFTSGSVTEESLQNRIAASAELYGRLRALHLSYHLATTDLLTPDQVALYNDLRGYSGAVDVCANPPAGHDLELWRLHNNCS